jgi:hypothetical protein
MFGVGVGECNKHAWYGESNQHCPYCLDRALSIHRMDEITKKALEIMEKEMAANANNIQHGGTHYKEKTVQPWDYIAANGLGYFEGNVVKYVSRWRDKGGVEDLRKARHYLDKLIELETRDVGKTN